MFQGPTKKCGKANRLIFMKKWQNQKYKGWTNCWYKIKNRIAKVLLLSKRDLKSYKVKFKNIIKEQQILS